MSVNSIAVIETTAKMVSNILTSVTFEVTLRVQSTDLFNKTSFSRKLFLEVKLYLKLTIL